MSWTIKKLEQDKRNPIVKLEAEFIKKQLSPMGFRKSTSDFLTHLHMNNRMQYRMFHHSKNIQPNGTFSFSKSFNELN